MSVGEQGVVTQSETKVSVMFSIDEDDGEVVVVDIMSVDAEKEVRGPDLIVIVNDDGGKQVGEVRDRSEENL